jgi:ABC-2 type transport system permease protein
VILIFLKDIRIFLHSLIGYLSLGIFFVLTFLFLWFIPLESGGMNIFDAGHASLEAYFRLVPWIFLFLVPAVCMRSFSEEIRLGTIELLLTKPIAMPALVWGKFLAGWFLMALSLLPFILYYYCIYKLGYPPGNIDVSGTWGAFTGLFLLAGVFVSIGNFSSSLTDNQVVAFVSAAMLIFIMYAGFDMLSDSGWVGSWGYLIQKAGLNEHYRGLSKGVLDSRDILYFFSCIVLFNWLTAMSLKARYQHV